MAKDKVIQSIQASNDIFIHPTADVSIQAKIGEGTRIWHHCQVRENAIIGRGCILGKGVYIDFGVQIGDHVKIQNGAYLYHGATIDSGVFIGPNAVLTNDKRPRAINPDGALKTDDDWEVGPIRVRYGASIGTGVIILPGVTVGEFAMIGAGSIVTRNVCEYALVLGNPAQHVGYVCKCSGKLVEIGLGQYQCAVCGRGYQILSKGS